MLYSVLNSVMVVVLDVVENCCFGCVYNVMLVSGVSGEVGLLVRVSNW